MNFKNSERKKLTSVIFAALILFTSCSWFANTNDNSESEITISGILYSNGALPQSLVRNAGGERTAVASLKSGLSYIVYLLNRENGDVTNIDDVVSSVNATISGTPEVISYEMKAKDINATDSATYYLRAIGYDTKGTTDISDDVAIIQSPDKSVTFAPQTEVFSEDLELRPVTTGSGTVELDITIDSQVASEINSLEITSTEGNTLFKIDGYTAGGTSAKIKQTAASITGGSYSVTINFYTTKSVNGTNTIILIYQITDVINVFNNLKTDKWIDNGVSPHLTTDSNGVCTCTITEAMLDEFKSTNIYVDKAGGPTLRGTFFQPYTSLAYAIRYINSIGNDTSTYTIHVKENSTVEDVASAINIDKKIKIEVYKTVPGKKDGSYILRAEGGNTLININSSGEVTLESDGTGGLKFITLSGSVNPLVSLSGKMVMYGGSIKISTGLSRPSLVTINNDSNAVFEMYGGCISENQNAGIEFKGANGVLKVAKKPYIYDNTTNVSLPAGKKIQIVGKLEEGALIGVTTATVPTLAAPVTITQGYGYQTGGYNKAVNPGKYFRSDIGAYGVTDDSMLETSAGEAVLSPSGGNFTVGKVINDLKITIDKSFVAKDDTTKKFTFTAKTDINGTPTTIEAGTGEGKVSYSYELRYKGETVPATGDTYYQTGTNSITLKDTLPTGDYSIVATATYKSKTYTAQFDVKIIEVDTITSTNISAMQLESGKKYYLKIDSTITNDNISGLVAKLKNNEDIGDSTLDLSEVNIETLTASLEMGTGNITEIVLPDSMTGVNTSATTDYFQGSSKLVSVIYNGNISMNWGNWAFGYCTSLKNFPWQTLETGRMGNCMFYECTSLETATIPSQVSLIGGYAFYNCSSLVEVHLLRTIPPQLENNECFSGCNSNLVFYVPAGTSAAYEAAGYSNYGTIQEE